MPTPRHHVIIGSGSAGFGAATTLRARDPDCRISLVTLSSLPFYNRYDLPDIFRGRHDWRDLLPIMPAMYDELGITLRRNSRVVDVNGTAQSVEFAHRETLHYDSLLVCAGGRGYLPEILSDYRPLMHNFASFEAAMEVHTALPKGGTVIMLGGDMLGLDLAFTLLDTGYKVALVTTPQTFWPHRVDDQLRGKLVAALEAKGARVHGDSAPVAVEEGLPGAPARRVILQDGTEISGDVVMPFCGLVPAVEFMLSAGVDIERGLLVRPDLRTTGENIWAAGDVCQIWSDSDKEYRFYHGWRNVREMGELAARNMTGSDEEFVAEDDGRIWLDKGSNICSTFWEH